GELGDGALDADLAAQGLPVEAERGAGIFGELAAFPAFDVGEEAEALVAYSLGQDHAHAGRSGSGGGGEGAGVGVVGLAGFGFFEPRVEQGYRVEGKRIAGCDFETGRHGVSVVAQMLAGVSLQRLNFGVVAKGET